MALQASGQISMSNIATEFGGSTPHALSEYYRGGAYVPNTGANTNVPTSGQIAMSQFYSASAVINHSTTISQSNVTDSCIWESPFTPTCLCQSTLTANVSNGVGPFTYSWERISGDTDIGISNTSIQSPVMSSVNPDETNAYYTATFRVTVTDTGNGNYQDTEDIVLNFAHEGI